MPYVTTDKPNNTLKFDEQAYLDHKQTCESAFNKFTEESCFWAFTNEQFSEGLRKFYDKLHDEDGNLKDKMVNLGSGMFCLKSDISHLKFLLSKNQWDLCTRVENDPDFARGAFLYEMKNHEYHLNGQADWDVCDCFTEGEPKWREDKTYVDYLSEAGYSDKVIGYYREARQEMFRLAEENDWY